LSQLDIHNARKFGIRDLYKMYRSKGLKLPIRYILENLLFDFTRDVSTHQYLQTDELKVEGANAKHSVLYMSSWTSVIRKSTREAIGLLSKPDSKLISFIDIGSGKGKVLLVWEEMFKEHSDFSILGIEFSKLLSNVCKNNLKNISAQKSNLFEGDVMDFSFRNLNNNIIFYMYNPFDRVLMNNFLTKVRSEISDKSNIIFIYNNSIHDDLFKKVGATELLNKNSWHPNGQYKIYSL